MTPSGSMPLRSEQDIVMCRQAVRKLTLRHARIAAFGATRRAGVRASDDRNLKLLVKAETPVVTLVAG